MIFYGSITIVLPHFMYIIQFAPPYFDQNHYIYSVAYLNVKNTLDKSDKL